MVAAIRWPDGSFMSATTWDELEQNIQDSQWIKYLTQESFREDMAERAMQWAGIEIEIEGSSQEFLWELERAQMLQVVLWVHPPTTQA